MDLDSVLAAASTVKRLRMYPYFDVANYILMCLAVRDDHTPPATATGRRSRQNIPADALEITTPNPHQTPKG